MATAASKSLLRDALSATTSKDKGPPVADGILSITPDTPEVVEWRRSALDITETTSTYLDDDDDGKHVLRYLSLNLTDLC
jgi:hypothetical protein